MSEPLLTVDGLVKHYAVRGTSPWRRRTVQAVNGVSFSIERGETLALVGESGCGKTTVGKTIMGFQPPTDGRTIFDGKNIATLRGDQLRSVRRDLQYVFQDPYASLPSRMTVGEIIAEPLVIHHVGNPRSRRESVAELLELVGLRPELINRYPHEFSGGQRQRVSVARALALRPKLLILDEPVSALDVSVQAQVVNLLVRLQQELGLSYLFIAHDLAVVRHLAHRVAVMYLGRVVEIGSADVIFSTPRHPYTRALLSAVPAEDPDDREHPGRIRLEGDPPDPIDPPSGCTFRTRCWLADDKCALEVPPLVPVGDGVEAACIKLPTREESSDVAAAGVAS